jgi:dihydrofolate synthase/folylpolyglutamate synthase
MAALLFPLADRVIVTAPANSRAMPPEEIPTPGATVTHTVGEAVKLLDEAAPSVVIFITGSLFVVGEARALLVQ